MKARIEDKMTLGDLWRRMPLGWRAAFVTCCLLGVVTCGRQNIWKVGPFMLVLAGIFLLAGIWDESMRGAGIFVLCWMAIAYLNNVAFYRWIVHRGAGIR